MPNEINLEVIHGQESDSPPPAFNQVEDEIDIQQITSETPQQDNPLLNVQDEIDLAPTTTSMDKLLYSKPKTKQAKSKRLKKHAKDVQDDFSVHLHVYKTKKDP